MGRAVGPDPHPHAGAQIAAEVLQDLAVARERRRAMGHGRAAAGQDFQVLPARPVQPGMLVDEDRVAEDRVRPQDAERLGVLGGRLAVAPDDLLELEDALREVGRERTAVLARRGDGIAEQIGGAGLDLGRVEHAGQAPAGVLVGLRHQLQGVLEAPAPGRLVPDELELEVVLQAPARRGVARRDDAAKPAPGQQVEPARIGRGQVRDGGDAALQQLAVGGLGTGEQALLVQNVSQRALVEAGHVHVRPAVFLADAAVGRLAAGVRMDIDQAGQDAKAAAVDDLLGGAGVAAADEGDRVAVEDDVAVAQIGMPLAALVPGDDPVGALDPGRHLARLPATRKAVARVGPRADSLLAPARG